MLTDRAKAQLLPSCNKHADLLRWIRFYTGMRMPTQAICPGHDAPMDYVWRAYREPAEDLVVWAPRGGGKTRLAALLTLLDMLHKPGCSIRILGGSLDQRQTRICPGPD